MKKIILFITYCLAVLLLCISSTFAQDSTKTKNNKWGIGLRLGAGLSYREYIYSNETAYAFEAGGAYYRNFNSRFNLSVGLQFFSRTKTLNHYNDPVALSVIMRKKLNGETAAIYHHYYHLGIDMVIKGNYNFISKEKFNTYVTLGIILPQILSREIEIESHDFSQENRKYYRKEAYDYIPICLICPAAHIALGTEIKLNKKWSITTDIFYQQTLNLWRSSIYSYFNQPIGISVGLKWFKV